MQQIMTSSSSSSRMAVRPIRKFISQPPVSSMILWPCPLLTPKTPISTFPETSSGCHYHHIHLNRWRRLHLICPYFLTPPPGRCGLVSFLECGSHDATTMAGWHRWMNWRHSSRRTERISPISWASLRRSI